MSVQNQTDSLRKTVQSNLYKIMITMIFISIIIFAIKKEGFFFGIH